MPNPRPPAGAPKAELGEIRARQKAMARLAAAEAKAAQESLARRAAETKFATAETKAAAAETKAAALEAENTRLREELAKLRQNDASRKNGKTLSRLQVLGASPR